ncbi:hypothetical protein VE01_05898 [Pseudogymnoascus verrucosus]|uniref:Uncharacterized protein n=1 Tax=Pseudogymnoascus verrucosus TaxID=342668 RepID=A0A1B8GII3_9PEZI|nr:uncharacterized protein VE01_05898 [Pseudogymnoascus verrucosus]OBT95618.1 hypothetical protein VE01_05898 [Pseudogymnoascus verrucosus]
MGFPPYTKTFHTSPYSGIDPSRPELSTAGKTIVVTGGGSGIGPRITQAFATSGATKIVILGRTVSSLEKTKKEVEAAHTNVTVYTSVADITDESAVSKAFEGIEKALGKVDILVSNAGYLPDTKPIAECNVEEWFRGMTVNVKGNLILSKAFLKHAAENPIFVHVSTGGCHIPPMPANSAYAVSKMAAARMMEYLAFENPQIRVHIIHPGVIQTEMYKKSSEGGLDFAFDDIELPASFAVWIVSPEAEFLQGKFVWSNWDIEELKAKKEHLLSTDDLTLGLQGWP